MSVYVIKEGKNTAHAADELNSTLGASRTKC